jgi:3-mercaptopyruvate sulfurtransferase SseA
MALVPNVMINASTLNNWLTMGYGIDTYGYYRTVILDVDSPEGYNQGHVPGAYLLEEGPADLWSTRSNGVSVNSFQVTTKAQMDAIIRRMNIDKDSIIVITGNSMTGIGRAYFNFRYWGFPRQQLKVLNVTNADYVAAGFVLENETPPSPEPCQHTVCNLQLHSSAYTVRASLQEMIHIAEDNNPQTIIIDSRSPDEYGGNVGSTSADRQEAEYVVFEGHINTALNLDHQNLIGALGDSNLSRSKELLADTMKKIGLDNTMSFFVYHRTGLEASITFLILDAVLNWRVKVYDGGWIQWGQMAGVDVDTGGQIEEGSLWRTDISGRSESVNYNKPNGFMVKQKKQYNSFAKQADEINIYDSAVCGITPKGVDGRPITPGY